MSLFEPKTAPPRNSFIFGTYTYQVVSPVVVVRLTSGSETYVYRNRVLPETADPDHVDYLLRQGFIREIPVTA